MSQVLKVHEGNGEPSMKKNHGAPQKLVGPEANKNKIPVREQFSNCCRICHSAFSHEKLISPCLCKGSLAFVHLSCLERWLNQSGRDTCELCTFRFEAEQTRRYSIYQGLRIWYRHPRHLSQLRADLVIGLVLTGVTLGLCSICIGGMKYFVLEGFRVGISYLWTEGVISFFLSVIILGYFTTVYLMLRDHIVPWYHWWSRCVNVRLILDMDMTPVFDPLSQMNCSNETLMVPSIMSLPTPTNKMEAGTEDRTQDTIILIPDISSSSMNMPSVHQMAPPTLNQVPSTNNQIPSVMSAVMSHIINTSIDRHALMVQQKEQNQVLHELPPMGASKVTSVDESQFQKSLQVDSKNVVPDGAYSLKITSSIPTESSADSAAVEITHPSHKHLPPIGALKVTSIDESQFQKPLQVDSKTVLPDGAYSLRITTSNALRAESSADSIAVDITHPSHKHLPIDNKDPNKQNDKK